MSKKFDIQYVDEDTIIFNGEILNRCIPREDCCRIVFMTDEYVIKMDSKRDIEIGYSPQSRDEKNLWKTVKGTEYEKYFLPVIYSKKIKETGSWANVQRRININYCKFEDMYENDIDFYDLITSISRRFRLYDINESRNATVDSEGNLLIFDYGI